MDMDSRWFANQDHTENVNSIAEDIIIYYINN